MEIKRDRYLDKLKSYMWDGQVKVITGIRRCGKSYLLKRLFRDFLLSEGVSEDNIISIELDIIRDLRYRNPLELSAYVRGKVEKSHEQHYLFVDEIQLSDTVANPYNPDGAAITFYDALNDLRTLPNLDIYVTGSNSKMLSSDILTLFRGRSDEIRMHPLTYSEFYSAAGMSKEEAFTAYALYGGMPLILSRTSDAAKMQYLESLFSEVYLKDIIERKKIKRADVLSHIVDLLCSSVGSLTNPTKIASALNSTQKRSGEAAVSANTVRSYIDYLADAFLFTELKRYDVKGKHYFDYPIKIYCEDVGLRNAGLGFRQEITHTMENIICNELIARGYSVDVGVIRAGKQGSDAQNCEIDFIATSGDKKYYIQSAYAMPDDEKIAQENRPLTLTGNSFPKMVVRRDIHRRRYNDQGILNIGVIDFLLDDRVM